MNDMFIIVTFMFGKAKKNSVLASRWLALEFRDKTNQRNVLPLLSFYRKYKCLFRFGNTMMPFSVFYAKNPGGNLRANS